jgi:DNA-binding MarR family transcriptional regulator
MTEDKGIDLEGIMFSYIEKFKFLLFPDQWSSAFLDYSKNEIMTILFLYRYKTANMTEISEFINSPLNTTTGVVNRLEKKAMVDRIRSSEDRRIVQIELTDKAVQFITEEKKVAEKYIKRLYSMLTEEEKNAAFSIMNKITNLLQQGKESIKEGSEVKKIKRITIE